MKNAIAWPLHDTSQIVKRLNWNEVPDTSTAYNIDLGLYNKLTTELSALSHSCDSVLSLVASLSLETKSKALRHPYVAGHLRGDLKLERDQFVYYLASAVLDTSYYQDSSNSANIAKSETVRTLKSLSIESPIHRGSSFCLLDYNGKYQIPEVSGEISTSNGLDCKTAVDVAYKVNEALSNLSRVSISAYNFVESYLWSLAVRANPTKPNDYSSFTFKDLPGLLLLCNPHLDSVKIYSIEESLLHESIHCFLYWVEHIGDGVLRGPNTQDSFNCVSPWTGNLIYPLTAFHAVLVWHGLGQYFKACCVANVNSCHAAYFRERYDFIEQGFMSRQFRKFYEGLLLLCSEHAGSIIRMVCHDCWDAV